MGTEIERKFLVTSDAWRPGAESMRCQQGYLAQGPPVSVRVRVMEGKATITIKRGGAALSRDEFEYAIPLDDARGLLKDLCTGHAIEKKRHIVHYEGMTWEIDEFSGINEGLVIAEIELKSEDEPFARPPWLGEEVTSESRYLNAALAVTPYCEW